jgi:two-component system sensor histidine kinase DesK
MREAPEERTAVGRAAPFVLPLAWVWLLFILSPALSRWPDRGEPRVALALVAFTAFCATYVVVTFVHWRGLARSLRLDLPLGQSYLALSGMVGTAVVMWLGLDQRGSGAIIFISVTAALVLPTRHAAVVVPLVSAGELALGFLVPGWRTDWYTPALALAAGFVMWGFKQVLGRNIELHMVRAENERLVVEQERNRFARDLHDILGHSLTVITVKTELARRLVDIDLDRAREELVALEELARESLADVRRAVQGYREITLPGEIARARVALTAAGIDHELPNSADDVPPRLRELFAWTIREGVTNVIRHSQAGSCTVVLAPDRVSVVDDGRGSEVPTHGNGLSGLVERAEAIGAGLVTRNVEPRGHALEVSA